jgi:hypothetical protein
MTKLIRVGFFREMAHGDPGDPSLAAERAGAPRPHQAELADYLAAGHLYIGTPGIAKDALDGKTMIGSPDYLTDGTYVWPGDAEYYVRKYNVRLADDFVAHAAARGFVMPESVEVEKLQL